MKSLIRDFNIFRMLVFDKNAGKMIFNVFIVVFVTHKLLLFSKMGKIVLKHYALS